MIITSPYEMDIHGDDNNISVEEVKEITLDERIEDLAKDYKDDLEGFMNELSVIKLTDEEKAHYINQHFSSIDMARLVYPLFIKCYENHKQLQYLKDEIYNTWKKSTGLLS